jgi:hypothetical protein
LLGLTSGAIRIDNYQEQELSGRTRKIMSMDIAVMEVLMKAPKNENDGIERVHEIGNVPNEKELENVDWERFYSTG